MSERDNATTIDQPTKSTSLAGYIVEGMRILFNFLAGRWYHAFLIMVLVASSAAAYSLWYVKDDLRQIVRARWERPTIKIDRMEYLAPQLHKQTGARAITLSRINVAADMRELAYSWTDDDTGTAMGVGRRSSLFLQDSSNNDRNVIRVIHGEAFCDKNDGFGLMPETSLRTVKFICVIGLPPGYSSEFVGLLAVGFETEPTGKHLILGELNRAAAELLR